MNDYHVKVNLWADELEQRGYHITTVIHNNMIELYVDGVRTGPIQVMKLLKK